MPNWNSCTFIGHLGQDPVAKPVGDSTVVNFSVAVNSTRRKNAETLWVDCDAWGKTGEFVSQYFAKGRAILVQGELLQRSYEKDGQKRTAYTLNVREATFADSKPQADAQPAAQPAPASSDPVNAGAQDDFPF